MTRNSRTGFIVYLNRTPIFWFSKKQGGIETRSFGSEFIAMKQCCEYLRGLRYKLRMMGIPVEGPAYIFGDNKFVLANSSQPDSVHNKNLIPLRIIMYVRGVLLMSGELLILLPGIMW